MSISEARNLKNVQNSSHIMGEPTAGPVNRKYDASLNIVAHSYR